MTDMLLFMVIVCVHSSEGYLSCMGRSSLSSFQAQNQRSFIEVRTRFQDGIV